MRHNIFPVFSSPIFASHVKVEDSVIEELNKEKHIKINLEEYAGSTSEDKFLLRKEKYSKLKKDIMNVLEYYNDTYLKFKTDFQMTTSWLAKTFPNTSSALHNHTNAFLSGVLSLAFNFMPCGNTGHEDSQFNYK